MYVYNVCLSPSLTHRLGSIIPVHRRGSSGTPAPQLAHTQGAEAGVSGLTAPAPPFISLSASLLYPRVHLGCCERAFTPAWAVQGGELVVRGRWFLAAQHEEIIHQDEVLKQNYLYCCYLTTMCEEGTRTLHLPHSVPFCKGGGAQPALIKITLMASQH